MRPKILHPRNFIRSAAAALIGVIGYALPIAAQTSIPPALTGTVSSAEEGAMEGVVVSAKKAGSIVTTSVVSDDKGRFNFPAGRLGDGAYALSIRAAGYDLDGANTVTLAGGKPAVVDVKLVKTKNLAGQLTNQEWMHSVPGADDQKKALSGCTNCHTVERIVNSAYTADEFVQVMQRMARYSNNSFYKKPQARAVARNMEQFVPNTDKVAAFFASINRSAGERAYPLKTMPRVSGGGTRVVITEYDLPNQEIQPHDVLVDADGVVWHSDFSGQILGRFDPRTLAYKTYPVPLQRAGWPTGALDLEADPQGNLWLGLMFQAGTAKFDKTSERFETWQLPPELLKSDSQQAMVGVQHWTVDNKIWLQDPSVPGIYRRDMTTGKTELFKPFENVQGPHSVYSIFADPKNNIWFLDFNGENIGKIDARSGEVALYPTPTRRSRPRRGRIDDQGRIWFAEFAQERIGVFDTRTEKFQEWEVPGKFFAPYDAALDRNGDLWTAGMNADRVLRLSTETGKFTEYPLPRQTNVRRVFVDNNTTPPTFWVGNNHGAALVKLEPLE
jgi:virginiamycin B lyase